MENKTLYHHGVKGMKWGVRKEPKLKNSSVKKKSNLRRPIAKKKTTMSQDELEYRSLKKKKRSELSNEELKKVNNRGKLLSENKKINPGTIAKGIAIATTALAAIATIEKIRDKTKPYVTAGVAAGKKATSDIINASGDRMVSELNAGFRGQFIDQYERG